MLIKKKKFRGFSTHFVVFWIKNAIIFKTS